MKPIPPSQISARKDCNRYHGFKYFLKVPEVRGEGGRFSEQGNRLHAILEGWNKTGTLPEMPPPPEFGTSEAYSAALEEYEKDIALVRTALPFAPLVKHGVSEGYVKFMLNGILYSGKRDHLGLASGLPGFDLTMYGDMPAVTDYKSSTYPNKWGLWTREKFLADPAAVLYMLDAAERSNSDVVGGRWLYMQTKGKPKSAPSDVVLGRDQLGHTHLRLVEPTAKEILQLRAAPPLSVKDVLTMDYNLAHCPAYGGCAYQHLCAGHFDIPTQVMIGIKKEILNMGTGLLSQLNGGAVAPVVNTAAPAGFVVPPLPSFTPAAPPQHQPQSLPVMPPGAAPVPLPAFPGFVGVNPPPVLTPVAAAVPIGVLAESMMPPPAPAPVTLPDVPMTQAAAHPATAATQRSLASIPADARVINLSNEGVRIGDGPSDAELGAALRVILKALSAPLV